MQDLDLFIANGVSIKGDGGFHRHQREQLQHVVLDHIANRPGLFEVGAPAFQAEVFRDGDLHVINIAPVPHRFKNAVGQTKNKDILDGFFAEVVVDTIDLFLAEDPGDLAVQFTCRGEVASKGFFDDNTSPAFAAFIQPRGTEALDDFRILTGRG